MRLRQRQAAFTLVELLVVIGIIALLISILLPALNKARAASEKVKCASQMKQVATAVFLYADDNKGAVPIAYDSRLGSGPQGYVVERLRPYLGDGVGLAGGDMYRMFLCPTASSGDRPGLFSIGYNSVYIFGKWWDPVTAPNPYVKLNRVRNAVETCMWIDAYENTNPRDSYAVFMMFNLKALDDSYGYPAFRHPGGANVAYCDGHVASVTEKEFDALYTLGAPKQDIFWAGN